MELIELRKELEEINKRITEFKTSLKIEDKTERVAEIENMMLDADFWNDSEAASLLVTESKSIKKELDEFSEMIDYLEHSEEMVEFLKDEDDEEIYQDLLETVVNLKSSVEDFSFRLLFSEEYDNNTAILEIHAGAGGTDATDWSELMLRMYERFFTKQGLKYSYLNYQSGDITGVKSATIKVEGDFAYGLLKGEKGVHRVVRISPFDPSGKRHTSFASIDVIPEFNDDEINIEINNEDLKIEDKTERVAEIENMMLEADFWNDSEAASLLVTESKSIKKELDEFSEMIDYLEHSEEMVEFLKDEDDEEIYQDLLETVVNLKDSVEDFSFRLLFSEEYDNNTAILEIHAGAGGTDATDWSELMLRMYERFFTKQGLKYSYLNYQSGDITGVKSATIKIEGDFAYGLLKGEKGVHRVVRISPFDPSGKRHTSFASIDVIPEFNDDEINIEINNEDLKIDTYRAQGAGGQHINTTDSAVRITHLPTGIVVQSQAERSQIKNKDAAMKNLKSKLYQREIEEKEKELAAIRGEQKDIGWGSQIRSYVFTPYTMVKDHRTNYEVSTVDKVMDGEIIDFIDAYLHYNMKEKEIL